MSNPKIIKTKKAGATVNKYRIVKFGADADHVIQGAAVTDKLIGVLDLPGPAGSTSVAEERVDVVVAGLVDVEAGGTIALGDLLSSDTVGKAVVAAPAAGVNNRIIGVAMQDAVSGDIFLMSIAPSIMQGA